MNQQEINDRIKQIQQKVEMGIPRTEEEKRFVMKHRDGFTEMEIDFFLSSKPEQNGKNGIIY